MRSSVPVFLVLVFALSTPGRAHAQPNTVVILTGQVLDGETGDPLIGANVFIAASLMGTTTDSDGRYRLARVPTGAHRLYVSMLGFEPSFRDLLLRESRVYTFDFTLEPAVLEIGEIIIEAERDDKWKDRLERFIQLFVGESPNAEMTVIVNPEVLDFESRGGTLVAYAAEPLIIENHALGYRIQYFLKDFEAEPFRTRYDGEPLFEELEAGSPDELKVWEENRRKAFMGSFRHFLLALLSGRTEGQGFKTYSRPAMNRSVTGDTFSRNSKVSSQRFPIDPQTMLRPGETPNEHILTFDGYIEIRYIGETEDPSYYEWQRRNGIPGSEKFQTSWITMERGPTVVDYKGDILNPYGVTFSGYLAFERVADEVPKEYRPN
ncbi:MAG: carboxypeptidase-like regulatory domain-containing protein [Rhodothermia bacterium]|nr:MAG: carboxypeptidase-like regulatory domain-containing protein [Rhodothermia bacterium]